MREIIFRGKRADNGSWETGSLVVVRGETMHELVFIADKMTGYHTPVTPETVGQYTGLTDKNGKKIFEGDIIRLDDCYGEGYAYVVCWDSYNCEYMLGRRTQSFGLANITTLLAEVIGNIHDNPELLGGACEWLNIM